MAFGAIDCPARGVEDRRKVLNGLEVELSDAKARRDRILIDLGKARAAVDKGDQRARFAQGGLNKKADAVGRLILSLEMVIVITRSKRCRRNCSLDIRWPGRYSGRMRTIPAALYQGRVRRRC
jgi:hypothetical protein